jgi:hypothetical protein
MSAALGVLVSHTFCSFAVYILYPLSVYHVHEKINAVKMDILSDYSVLSSGQKATPFTHPLSDLVFFDESDLFPNLIPHLTPNENYCHI